MRRGDRVSSPPRPRHAPCATKLRSAAPAAPAGGPAAALRALANPIDPGAPSPGQASRGGDPHLMAKDGTLDQAGVAVQAYP